jgi:hypothetical protein
MNFGPAEMAQTMDAAKALIAVAVVYSVGIGIVLGAIVALYRFFRHRAADQSLLSGMPTDPALPTGPALPSDPALPTGPAQEIDATAQHRPRPPVPRAGLRLIRPVDLLGIIILIAITGGGYLSYYTSKRSDFKTTNNNQVRIQSPETIPSQPGIQLPPTIEPQQQMPEAAPNQPPSSNHHLLPGSRSRAPPPLRGVRTSTRICARPAQGMQLSGPCLWHQPKSWPSTSRD